MKTTTPIVMIVSVAFAMAACQRAPSPVSPTTAAVAAAAAPEGAQAAGGTKASAFTFTFTKIPAQWAAHYISAGPGVQAFVFEMDSTGTTSTTVAQMAFMITGILQAGYLSNFKLVYYPDGLTKPGSVIGVNDGSTWAPGPLPSNFLRLNLTPLTLGKSFKGVFALLADVNATTPFVFYPQLQTATINVGGIEQLLTGGTCDLPLPGDTFYVNGFSY